MTDSAGTSGVVLRQPIYEKDRLDPIDPSAELKLDGEKLNGFPVDYRHVAYAQQAIGYRVKRDMPGLTGPTVAELYRNGRSWLSREFADGAALRQARRIA